MKSLMSMLIMVCLAVLMMGCPRPKPDDNNIQPQPQPVPQKQIPPETIPEKPLLNEDKPSPHVSVADDPKGHIKEGSVAEDTHLQKVKDSQDVVENVPQTRMAPVEMKVEMKDFDNFDVQDQVRERIFETAHNNNYKIDIESQPSKRHIILKIWSELPGPLSFEQTLKNSLADYDVRLEHRSDRYILITPRK